MQLDIEIFPTAARIPKGWSLRLAVGTSDFPHAVSPLPAAVAQQGGVLTVLHDPKHPSSVAIPFIGAADGIADNGPAVTGSGDGKGNGNADDGDDPQVAAADSGGGAPTLPATGGGAAGLGVLFLLASAALTRRRRPMLSSDGQRAHGHDDAAVCG
jgi:hypothetical protein